MSSPAASGDPPGELFLANKIDELCDAFERAWQDNGQPGLEDFLERIEAPARGRLFRELLLLEIDYRTRRGTCIGRDDYAERFPHLRSIVDDVFDAIVTKPGTPLSTDDTIAPPERVSATRATSPDDTLVPSSSDPQPSVVVPAFGLLQQIGRYRVERVLGEGAFGRVYLAHDDQLQRAVAIKVPRPDRLSDPDEAQAYLQEARTVARLDHPNIVPIYDVGTTSDGICYVVSRLITGGEQYREFDPDYELPAIYTRTANLPVVGVSWYQAAAYLNWLSEQEGIPKEQWCYLPNQAGKYEEGMSLAPNYLSLAGYRLPRRMDWNRPGR